MNNSTRITGLTFRQRLQVLFTGKLKVGFYSLNEVEPVNCRRCYSLWFNKKENWFEIFDENNESVRMMTDVTVADNWLSEKDCPLRATVTVQVCFVDKKPIPHETH